MSCGLLSREYIGQEGHCRKNRSRKIWWFSFRLLYVGGSVTLLVSSLAHSPKRIMKDQHYIYLKKIMKENIFFFINVSIIK